MNLNLTPTTIKKIGLVSLGIVTLAILAIGLSKITRHLPPTQIIGQFHLTPTPSASPKPLLSAWIAQWDQDLALPDLISVQNQLAIISPVWYQVTETGQIIEIPKLPAKLQITQLAATSEAKLLPTIINDHDNQRAASLLKNKSLQQTQIDKLVSIAIQNKFDGYDLDWEQINPVDRTNFSNYVASMAQKLHAQNLLLSVTLHAQTGSPTDWEGTKGQDYSSLGQSADLIRIMAYDFHNEDTPPGPVTPIDTLKTVLEYAKLTIPVEKIVLGLPTYGYDWTGAKGEPLQYQDIMNRLASLKASAYLDSSAAAMRSDYTLKGLNHHIWFDNQPTLLSKINLAQSMGINQFCFWRLGGEDQQIWSIPD